MRVERSTSRPITSSDMGPPSRRLARGAVRSIFEASALHARPCSALAQGHGTPRRRFAELDRKSTRLNSSHLVISYAVFCLKKKMFETRVYLNFCIGILESDCIIYRITVYFNH